MKVNKEEKNIDHAVFMLKPKRENNRWKTNFEELSNAPTKQIRCILC